MQKRYRALRTVGTLYKVLGMITAIITVAIVIGICGISVSSGTILNDLARNNPNANFIGVYSGVVGSLWAIVILIYGGGVTLTLFAAGEGIYLLIALEENTRLTSTLLQQPNYQSLPQNSPSFQPQFTQAGPAQSAPAGP